MENSSSEPRFQVLRYYVKDIICKVPHSPRLFTDTELATIKEPPTTSFELQVKQQVVALPHYEVCLHMTATSKLKERTLFTVDIQQAGIFSIENQAETQLAYLLNVYCPSLLYPYLSNAIASASMQAGFPPLLLSPMNFEQLYQSQQSSEKQQATKTTQETITEKQLDAATLQ